MKFIKLWLPVAGLLVMLSINTFAQKSKTQKPKTTVRTTPQTKPAPPAPTPDAATNEKKVRDIITFLEFMLNTLGNSTTSSRDKDVLITESYSKIFRDGNVQIEDDLDEEREISTNKNVVAYLKDVDFFFKDVKFEFTIDKIERGENPGNLLYYRVSLKRNLKGTTTAGKSVNNTVPRYIEVNYNTADQDLRIASIYTHEIDQKAALVNWWKQLSLEWQAILKQKSGAPYTDSVSFEDLQKILLMDTLDISGNEYIRNIEPLTQLTNLHVLRMANTQIADISPVRNLTGLTELSLANSKVEDLNALRYCDNLTKLDISRLRITDLTVLQKLPHLKILIARSLPASDFSSLANSPGLTTLNLSKTSIQNLTYLETLIHLQELNISSTPIHDLGSLRNMKELTSLNIDSTQIASVTTLSGAEQLKILHANSTLISDLQPLLKLPHLETIYCDKTKVNRTTADLFMEGNPKVLVVFDSEDLFAWWETLNNDWRDILSRFAGTSAHPTKDDLAKITNIDSVNIISSHIDNLEPLRKLLKLKFLIVGNTSISDLTPLQALHNIEYLNISETEVADISPIQEFTHLKIFRADKSRIQSLRPLYEMKSLKNVYVDETAIHDITAREFLEKQPTCLLVYKTIHINRWWSKISEEWKQVFRKEMGADSLSSRENFHKLLELEILDFSESPVNDLSALSEFVRLRELLFSGTAITDLTPLVNFKELQSLHATNSPLQKIEALNQLMSLTDLDISNTPIDEVKVVAGLSNLKTFNCSGTQIKKIDALSALPALEYLDCSNTRVGNLGPVSYRSLKTLKCYNTKVSAREIDAFKKANPKCTVVYYR